MKYIIIILSIITVITLLIILKYFVYNEKTSNLSQLIKGPGTNPNDEYYPIIVNDKNGLQNLYTNKSKFNYDTVNNILYVDNIEGNLKNKSVFAYNLLKENASNNLLVQQSNNSTSLISPGNIGDVLFSNGTGKVPSWKYIYENIPGFNSILFRPEYSLHYDIPTSTDPISPPILPILSEIDSSITLTTNKKLDYDLVVKNLTINSGVTLYTNGCRINVSEKLIINGSIVHDRSMAVYSTLASPIKPEYINNILYATSTNFGGGAGGDGAGVYETGDQGLGGKIVYPSNKEGGKKLFYQYPYFLTMGYYDTTNKFITYKGGASGGKGNDVIFGSKYLGGNGGIGGGVIHICAKNIEFGPNGKIEAPGGNGSNGQADINGNIISGGGGGGGGGLIVIVTNTKRLSPTDTTKFNVSGGNPGMNGDGKKGEDGKVIIFDNL